MFPLRFVLSFCIFATFTVGAGAGQLFTTKSIPPKLRLEFHTQPDNNREVRQFFVAFARAEGFAVADGTSKMPLKDRRPIFNLELRRGGTATVNVTNIVHADQYLVFIYEPNPNDAFAGIVSRLTDRIKEKWPNARPYHDQ